MMRVFDLTSDMNFEKFKITGRGHMIVFDTKKHGAENLTIGDIIADDGHDWEIIGLERYSVLTYPPRKSSTIGFLVKEKQCN